MNKQLTTSRAKRQQVPPTNACWKSLNTPPSLRITIRPSKFTSPSLGLVSTAHFWNTARRNISSVRRSATWALTCWTLHMPWRNMRNYTQHSKIQESSSWLRWVSSLANVVAFKSKRNLHLLGTRWTSRRAKHRWIHRCCERLRQHLTLGSMVHEDAVENQEATQRQPRLTINHTSVRFAFPKKQLKFHFYVAGYCFMFDFFWIFVESIVNLDERKKSWWTKT